MAKSYHVVDAKDQHILTLRIICLCLLVGCGYMYAGWRSAPQDITVHVPPDLSEGGILGFDEIPPPNVYLFSFYIYQQINLWSKDGSVDYKKNIEALGCYITPHFREQLLADYSERLLNGELKERSRSIHQIPSRTYERRRVVIESDSSWQVYMDLRVVEEIATEPVRDTFIQYPLRVVRYDIDRECNPWGIAIDDFVAVPRRLNLDERKSLSTQEEAK